MLSGKVVDQIGNPIPWATIKFKGSSIGTCSGEDGTYSVPIPNHFDTAVCSHVDYNTTYQVIEGNNLINFILDPHQPIEYNVSITGIHNYQSEQQAALENKIVEIPVELDKYHWTKIEVNASFPGGENAFNKYAKKSMAYPDSSTIPNVHGVVKVSFVIGINGLPLNITLLKGVNKYADKIVLEAIKKMPKWNSAIQNGRYVAQKKEVSILFDITGKMD